MRLRAPSLALLLAIAPLVARAVPVVDEDEFTQGLVWLPQPVRFPVSPAEVNASAPFVPRGAPEASGDIEIAPKAAAVFWLDALEVVRVRRTPPDSKRGGEASVANLVYERVVGPDLSGASPVPTGAARVVLEEAGSKDPAGDVLLAEPPGDGSVWMIESDAPVRVSIERPSARTGKLIWDAAGDEMVRWIEQGGELPVLPPGADELRFQLDADAALTKDLLAAAPGARLKEAIRAWRKASALELLERTRPVLRPAFTVDDLATRLRGGGSWVGLSLVDPSDPDPRPWLRVAGTSSGDVFSVSGPAILEVEARGVLDGRAPDAEAQEISVRRANGATLAVDRFDPSPTRGTVPQTAMRAFPDKEPLTATNGEWIGARESVEVRVPPGPQRYVVSAKGGPMLVRVTLARPRPIAADLTRGRRETWEGWAGRGRELLAGESSAQADVVRARLALLLGDAATASAAPRGDGTPLTRIDRAASFLLAADDEASGRAAVEQSLLALLHKAEEDQPKTYLWWVRLALTRRYGAAGDLGRVRSMLAGVDDAPPRPVLAALAEIVPEPLPFEDSDSRRLAYEELAWRLSPADRGVRGRYQRLWNRTEWARLTPTDGDLSKTGFTLSAWTWLSTQGRGWDRANPRPVRSLDAYSQGACWRFAAGTPVKIRALPSAFDPTQAPIVRLFVRTPSGDPGPYSVRVGDRSFQGLAVAGLEPVEIAVAPGSEPTLSVEGPRGTDAFVALPPATGFGPASPTDFAKTLRLRSAAVDGTPVRYLLPDPLLPGPVQITLATLVRGSPGAPGAPIELRLRTDRNFSRTFRFAPGVADPATSPVDAPAPLTMPVTFTVALPPGVHTVWLESKSSDVVAGFAIRRARVYGPTSTPGTGVLHDPLERVADATRQLASRPTDPALLLARANALLDVGDVDYAEQDAIRLVKRASTGDSPAIEAEEDRLFDRITTGRTPAYLGFRESPPTPIPAVVLPGALVLDGVDLAAYAPAVRAMRETGPDAALAALGQAPPSPYATWLRARFSAAQSRNGVAGMLLLSLFESSGRWQFGLESLRSFRKYAAVDSVQPGEIARIYGVAALVREHVEHPWARETLLAATRTTQWAPITDTDANAGIEMLSTDPSPQLTEPIAAIRQALLATPWPTREARVVRPGNGTGLDLVIASKSSLTLEIFCERVRYDDPGEPAPCEVSARLDQGAPRLFRPTPAKTLVVPFTGLAAGRHRVEVYLARSSRAFLAGVHFVAQGALATGRETALRGSVEVEQSSKLFVARTDRPVELTVLGPTVLSVESRASLDQPAAALDVRAAPIAGIGGKPLPAAAAAASRTVSLDLTPDPAARDDAGGDARVSRAVDSVLILHEPAVYHVAVRPSQRGTAMVRLGLREEGREADDVDPLAWRQQGEGADLLKPPRIAAALGDVGAAARASSPGRFGLLTFEQTAGREATQDTEGINLAGPAQAESTLVWGDNVVENRLWLQAAGFFRSVEQNTPTTGGRGDIQATAGSWRLALRGVYAHAEYYAQPVYSVTGEGYLDRRIDLGATTFLLPSVRAFGARQSMSPIDVDPLLPPDPMIFGLYRALHDRQVGLRTALWWFPTQDQLFEVRVGGYSNRDFASADNLEAMLDYRVLVGTGPVDTRIEAFVQSNRWLADSDRPVAYDSHKLALDVAPSLWAGRGGRISLVAHDTLLLFDDATPPRNVVEVGLRFDLARGRGLGDILPLDLDFADLAGHRWWEPAAEESP